MLLLLSSLLIVGVFVFLLLLDIYSFLVVNVVVAAVAIPRAPDTIADLEHDSQHGVRGMLFIVAIVCFLCLDFQSGTYSNTTGRPFCFVYALDCLLWAC